MNVNQRETETDDPLIILLSILLFVKEFAAESMPGKGLASKYALGTRLVAELVPRTGLASTS